MKSQKGGIELEKTFVLPEQLPETLEELLMLLLQTIVA